jgi:hypothetical protein
MSDGGRRDGFITWPALLDAGLTHVDVLNRGSHDASTWIVRSADGHALVKIHVTQAQIWVVEAFVPVDLHAGAASTSAEWTLEESRTYLGGEVGQMLDDVAAVVG